jgi:hypothetical protein
MTKISVIFSMDAIELPESERDNLRALFSEWVITSSANGRFLIDALISQDNFNTAEAMLAGYNPIVIGKWDEQGDLLSTFNKLEYIAMLPPVITYDDLGNVVSSVPRSEPVEIHRFGGRAARTFNTLG